MDLASKALAAIAQRLDACSWHADRIGDAILIHPLGITLTTEIHVDGAGKDARCVIVTATHPLFPEGIQDHAVGFGNSDDEVAAVAANTWFDLAFSVIHSLTCTDGDGGVQVMDLVTHDTASGDVFAWKAHVSAPGNIAMDGITSEGADGFEFMKSLLGALSEVLLDRRLHTLRCFLGILPSGAVYSEALFDGTSWDSGTDRLNECANRWLERGHREIRKQFMLFAPCDLADLKNGEALAAGARAEGVRKMTQ